MDNPIIFAIPFFFTLIAIELAYGFRTGNNTYRTNDSITSIATGILSQLSGAVTKLFLIVLYVLAYENFAYFNLSAESVAVWIAAFVVYDLCYYWFHRIAHEYNVFWAGHITHHSSEDYNLSTALRQTSTTFWFSWIFYLPLALAGVPPVVFVTVAALNLVYQYWVHTQHIPKLGWYENFFVTPSNHRVHHGQNDQYIDKNYGGVFILWDRFFGTFQEELDDVPVVYGIKKPVHSWNPVWANVHYYVQLYRDALHTKSWKDKIQVWFKRTGWRPEDVAEQYPIAKVTEFEKYEIKLNLSYQVYALIQFVFANALTLYVLANNVNFSFGQNLVWLALVGFWLYSIGQFMELRTNSKVVEVIRLHLYCLLGLALFTDVWGLGAVAIYYALTLIGFLLLKTEETQASPEQAMV